MALEIQSQECQQDQGQGKSLDHIQDKITELKDKLRALETEWTLFESSETLDELDQSPIIDRQLILVHNQLSRQFELIQNLTEQLKDLSSSIKRKQTI